MTDRFAVFAGAAIPSFLPSFFPSFLSFASSARADTICYADAICVLANDCGPDIKMVCRGLNLVGVV